MMRVLVTGASGFIGRHCLQALLTQDRDVHAVTSRDIPDRQEGIHWHRADLLDAVRSENLFRDLRPTHLLHLAWYTEHGSYWNSTENIRWVEASLGMVRHFARHGGKRAVGAGTCAEYDWSAGLCTERSTPLIPRTLYGQSKKAVCELLEGFGSRSGVSTAWGRLFFAYGPHEAPPRLVASVVRSLLRGEPARCTHARQIRDLLHVQDAAAALVALLGSEVTGPVNIASGRPVALKDVIATIASKLDRGHLVQLGAIPAPDDDPPSLLAAVDRLREEVGWKPAIDLDTGLDLTIRWWRERLQRARPAD